MSTSHLSASFCIPNILDISGLNQDHESECFPRELSCGVVLQAGQASVWILAGVRVFHFSRMSILTLVPTQPPSQWVPGFYPHGWLGHETVHSCPSGIKVKNKWICTSIPPVSLHCVDRDSITSAVTRYLTTVTGLSCLSSILPFTVQNFEIKPATSIIGSEFRKNCWVYVHVYRMKHHPTTL